MPRTPSQPPRRNFQLADWTPARRAWLWVAAAFVAGLLLFVIVRPDGQSPATDDDARPTAARAEYDPLPAPLPAGAADASGMDEERLRPPEPEERPQLVEAPPPPPPPPLPPEPPVAPATTPSGVPMARGSRPEPIEGRMPPPSYPAQALRRGEFGTVVVRAEVGPDGVPTSVSVARSSGSRTLDRAAAAAVNRWRFRPAQLEGRPTVGSVLVPIEFKPRR
ncbi:energy transducer TonB [Lysobacter sp. A3-1-A15]|uniref:energy transducer TonB n=1 Tax=Novilysobacter viscosus TaxID=3098602 RepID=UPI002EDA3377